MAISNEKYIHDFLKNRGFKEASICGVIANIRSESNFRPWALGDKGTSYGICQWHNSRWDRMKSYCAKNGYEWEVKDQKSDASVKAALEGQLNYLLYELQKYYGRTVYIPLTSYPNTEEGAYSAAYVWCYYFEVPANRAVKAAARGNTAKTTYWPKYKPEEPYEPAVGDKIILEDTGWYSNSYSFALKKKGKWTTSPTGEIKKIYPKRAHPYYVKLDEYGTGYVNKEVLKCQK